MVFFSWKGSGSMFGFYIILGIVFFAFFYSLAERPSDRTFVFSEYMKDKGTAGERKQEPATIVERYLKPLLIFTQKSVKLSDDRRENLRLKLQQASMIQTPETFMATKVIYTAFVLVFFLILFAVHQKSVLLLFAVGGAVFIYFYPNRQLERNIKYAIAMRRMELPDYLTPLSLLMYSHTPYQAVKKCEDFAGPFLKPYVQKLMMDVDLNPGSVEPFQDFAKNVGVAQAQTFIIAIQQAFTTDSTRSREILEKQVEVMAKLREESYNELINKKPLAVNKYNAIMLMDMALIPLSTLFFVFSDVFGNLTS